MLRLDHLSKSFRGKPALESLTLDVAQGEVFGLLGHNGAGKSTTFGLILGQLRPTAGEAFVRGVSVQRERERALQRVGAIFETPAFYDYLSGWRNLNILTALSGRVERREMEETVRFVGLEKRIHDPVRVYSHGMRQRLALAQALLPWPELILLDEPSEGLDPEGIHELRELILRINRERGVTVVLSSHLLAEVEQTCGRVAILNRGRLVFQGHWRELRKRPARYRLRGGRPGQTARGGGIGRNGAAGAGRPDGRVGRKTATWPIWWRRWSGPGRGCGRSNRCARIWRKFICARFRRPAARRDAPATRPETNFPSHEPFFAPTSSRIHQAFRPQTHVPRVRRVFVGGRRGVVHAAPAQTPGGVPASDRGQRVRLRAVFLRADAGLHGGEPDGVLLPGLFLALVAGDMVSKEVEDGTMRMMLCRPVSRWRLGVLKYLACVVYTFALTAFYGLSALAAGTLYQGTGGLFAAWPPVHLFALYEPGPGLEALSGRAAGAGVVHDEFCRAWGSCARA